MRRLRTFRPACLSLEERVVLSASAAAASDPMARQLLSTVPAAPAVMPIPPATAVANAAADLNALATGTFAEFQADLAKAESHSRVTEAQAGKLAQAETSLDAMIESADLHPVTSLGHLNLQDVVAGAFRESPAETRSAAPLDEYVVGEPGGDQLVERTIAQMEVISRATRTPTPLRDAILSDWQVLEYNLGPNPDTDLGPGATDRDPLEVYFNGQVNDFIKD